MGEITDKEVDGWLSSFLKSVEDKYSPSKVILFGSRARGDHLKTSDVDLIIVSEHFADKNWIQRMRDVSELWEGLVNIEALCYTPEEFNKKTQEIGIVREAVGTGKTIHTS